MSHNEMSQIPQSSRCQTGHWRAKCGPIKILFWAQRDGAPERTQFVPPCMWPSPSPFCASQLGTQQISFSQENPGLLNFSKLTFQQEDLEETLEHTHYMQQCFRHFFKISDSELRLDRTSKNSNFGCDRATRARNF